MISDDLVPLPAGTGGVSAVDKLLLLKIAHRAKFFQSSAVLRQRHGETYRQLAIVHFLTSSTLLH